MSRMLSANMWANLGKDPSTYQDYTTSYKDPLMAAYKKPPEAGEVPELGRPPLKKKKQLGGMTYQGIPQASNGEDLGMKFLMSLLYPNGSK